MSAHTTFRSGGPAQVYLEVDSVDDLIKACSIARQNNESVKVLGAGSSIIVSDKGIYSLVIKNNCRRFEMLSMIGRVANTKVDLNQALVFAEAGVILNQLVRFTLDQGLGGLEYQLGLPGTVGGAVFMNANYPKEEKHIGDAVYRAKILLADGSVQEVDSTYFHFKFNKSALSDTGAILLSVIFRLFPMDKKALWNKATEAINYRNETHPKEKALGLTFRNLSIENPQNLLAANQYTVEYLFDRAGIKGKHLGGAAISAVNPRYFLNMDSASESDVLSLTASIKQDIEKTFGLRLIIDIAPVE
ncbi:MAG: FAD-binding protein [Candidatus Levybacteria bacterium]|nr:FAD-binding protein [Candidatus Levybacteria bacterium]